MKGNQQLIEMLNKLLAAELAAVNQYMVHSEMAENWQYIRLYKLVRARAMVEMKHAEKLIERILFLEAMPIVSKLDDIRIGSDVPKQFESDLAAEMRAVRDYNAAIKLAHDVGDNATKDILENILNDEDRHVDEIEAQQDQITQIGLGLYLNQQVRE